MAEDKNPFHAVIPWHVLKANLERLQRVNNKKLLAAEGDNTLRAQGEGQLLDKLLNLPETLTLTQEDDNGESSGKDGT